MSRDSEALDARLCALLDGELTAEAEAELRGELAASPALAARLEELRSVDAALRSLPERPVPGDALAQLRERIAADAPASAAAGRRAAARATAPPRRRRWLPALVAVAAAAGLALLVLPRLGESPSSEEPPQARRSDPASQGQLTPSLPAAPPSAEEIALALAVESESDLEVIEMLDWLTALGEVESS